MTTVAELFPSKYVAAVDVQVPVQVQMSRVEIEDVGNAKERKPVLYFTGKSKGLVLNKTNANRIAETHGQELSSWMGKTITLYASETNFKGDTVPCVRVRCESAAPPPEPTPAVAAASAVF
jgi:CYTH domain-containing protein